MTVTSVSQKISHSQESVIQIQVHDINHYLIDKMSMVCADVRSMAAARSHQVKNDAAMNDPSNVWNLSIPVIFGHAGR